MTTSALIIRYFNGECTPEEALYIETWAASSPENGRLLEEAWQRFNHTMTGAGADANIPDPRAEWSKLKRAMPRHGWFRIKLYWIVPAVVVVTVIVWLLAGRSTGRLHSPVQPSSGVPPTVNDTTPRPAVLSVSPMPADTIRVFDFKNTSLEEASRVLARAYGVQFVPRNPGLLKCRFTTRFDHDSLTYILDVITETLNIHYEYGPDRRTVYLSGAGCE